MLLPRPPSPLAAEEAEEEVTVENLDRVVNGGKKNLPSRKKRKSLAKQQGFHSESNISKNCPFKIYLLTGQELLPGNSKNSDPSREP
jgi:hypothetical protein